MAYEVRIGRRVEREIARLDGEAIVGIQRYLVYRLAHMTMACFVPFMWGMASVLYGGWSAGSVFLMAGAVGSVLGLFLYVLAILSATQNPRRSFALMLGTWAGFIPYLFGCYLTFYEGFWGFVRLFAEEFSLFRLGGNILFLALGAVVVSITYDTTEFHKSLPAVP